MMEMRTATLPESAVPPRSAMLAYLALTTAAMVWGGSVVFQKSALSSFSPFEVSVLRGLGALLVLCLYGGGKRQARYGLQPATCCYLPPCPWECWAITFSPYLVFATLERGRPESSLERVLLLQPYSPLF